MVCFFKTGLVEKWVFITFVLKKKKKIAKKKGKYFKDFFKSDDENVETTILRTNL
jgi:hypothetical protein